MRVMCGHCKTYHPSKYDVYACSRNMLGSRRRPVLASSISAPAPAYGAYPLSAPEAMVLAIRDGRFAVNVGNGDHQKVVFLRVSRPKRGQFAGCFKVQTQHSESYRLAYVKYPSGQWRSYTHDYRLDEVNRALTVICVNPLDAAILYAKEKGVCGRCGTELTDERSRYYNIGPECIKHWPDMVNKVHNEKGIYVGDKPPYSID